MNLIINFQKKLNKDYFIMKKIINKILSFFRKEDVIKQERGSSFYQTVIVKGKKKLNEELFDKNSDSYLFKQRG